MELSPQVWDAIKMLIVAYLVYLLHKHDKNMTELFKRITTVEINCARNTGPNGLHIKQKGDGI